MMNADQLPTYPLRATGIAEFNVCIARAVEENACCPAYAAVELLNQNGVRALLYRCHSGIQDLKFPIPNDDLPALAPRLAELGKQDPKLWESCSFLVEDNLQEWVLLQAGVPAPNVDTDRCMGDGGGEVSARQA